MTRPPVKLAVTPGEPAGIGPDLVIQAAQRPRPDQLLIAVADPDLLMQRAARLGLPLETVPWSAESEFEMAPGRLAVVPVPLTNPVQPGQLDPANAGYVLACLDQAVAGCQDGRFDALVTGPLHKGIINQAGHAFSGHTEYLASLTGTSQVVMMLATPGLRVALATTHLPLREVADAITRERLEAVLRILHSELIRHFGLARPRILVCGLNPHAGEQGHLGREEIEVIEPVLEKLRAEPMKLVGPLPADTLFTPDRLETADAVLAMYHDQGLPVLKHKGFGKAVNVTLGLPIIRTSVDHGTALELAGSGRAEIGSLEYAIEVALEMVAAAA